TMADFWGIQRILPEMDDDKGTSLIFVNSPKGQAMIEKVKDKMIYKLVDIHQAVSFNSAAIKSVKLNPNRENFFEELDELDFDKLVKKHCKVKLSLRFKNKIKSMGVNILKKKGTYNWVRSKVRKNK
ncbi:MAG: (4Fe-4S)-binding protein, partial [Erysipelotrichaceae bacterium]|nr:(4Fe-4S)-binding protein [Erysipelotrichaceae bacterium]